MRVVVLALDLAAPGVGRGDEAWEPPPDDGAALDPAEACALLARAAGHEAQVLRLGYGALEQLDALDARDLVALNLVEGVGRDGDPGVEVIEALHARGVPVAGADRDFLLLGLDKAVARERLARRGVPVAPGVVIDDAPDALDALARLRPPLVVKPREGGGSAGLEVVVDARAVRSAVEQARRTYGGLVVEELVAGPEVSVALLGSGERLRVLPPVEVAYADDAPPAVRVLRFADKHGEPTGRWWLEQPPRLSGAALEEVVVTARAAYEALGGCGHGRVDLRLGPSGPVVLEVNPNPSLVPTLVREEQGLYARALAAGRVSLVAWVRLLIDDALARAST